MTIRQSIKEEAKKISDRGGDICLQDCHKEEGEQIITELCNRTVNFTLESLLEDMPDERKDGNQDTVYGFNSALSEIREIIKSKKI